MLLNPSLTWNRWGAHRVRYACQARSLENQIYVVLSSLVGGFGVPAAAPLYGKGSSVIFAPVDKKMGLVDGIVAKSDGDAEQLVIADLNLDLLADLRSSSDLMCLRDMRPRLYSELRRMIRAAADHARPFIYQRRVRYQEVDPQAVVYHSRYFEYMDEAMTEFFREALGQAYPDMVKAGFDPSVVGTQVNFAGPARFDDMLEISVRTSAIGDSSLAFDFGIRNVTSQRPIVSATITYANVDAAESGSRPIPDFIRDRIQPRSAALPAVGVR